MDSYLVAAIFYKQLITHAGNTWLLGRLYGIAHAVLEDVCMALYIAESWLTRLYSNLNLSSGVKGRALAMRLLYPQSARSPNYRATYDIPHFLV